MEPNLGQFTDFVAELEKESDRGMAVLAMALVEDRLRELLHKAVGGTRKEADNLAPSMGRLTEVSEMLGLLSKDERHDLAILARIRNRLAHDALLGANLVGVEGASDLVKLRILPRFFIVRPVVSNRMRFLMGAASVIGMLSKRLIEQKPFKRAAEFHIPEGSVKLPVLGVG